MIPKEHIATANDATDEALMGRLIITAASVAKERGFAEQGYRLVMNCNSDGGQTVSHIHLHCLGWQTNDLASWVILIKIDGINLN